VTSPPPARWLRRLLGYCLAHRRDLYVAFGAAIAGAVVSAAVPLAIRHVVDTVTTPEGATGGIGVWVAALVLAALVQYGLTFSRRFAAGRLSLQVQYDMRRDVFVSLSRLDGRAQDELDTGQVVSRSITDIGLVQGLLAFVPLLASNALLFVVSLVVMVFLSPVLTVVTLAVAPALWFVASASRRDLFPANWDAQQQAGELVGHVEAAVTGVRVVKGFGQEQRELRELETEATDLFRRRLRVVRLQAKYAPALQAIPALGQVGVLLLGGWLALSGDLTLGTFLAFSTYLGQLVSPVRQLTALLTIGQQARAGVERVLDIVDARPSIVDEPDAVDLPAGPVGIEFRNVRFGYDEDAPPVLNGLTLSVAPGETVALVGGSGSGKSTIVNLLSRQFDPQAGMVALGGLDLRRTRLDSVRSALSIVFDESFLFSDTIAANIAYGRPDATTEEIHAAARQAEAEEFIAALPDGYDTVVGERGLTLSGGQRQRIAIARALLYDARVLVLDDATSAIDPRVEARINARLRVSARRRTTLLIAHRRSTLDLADRIVVLDHGQVVDSGPLAELAAGSPAFQRLFDPDAAIAAAGAAANRNGHQPARVGAMLADPSARFAAHGRRAAASPGDGGLFGALPATPELIAQVAALPPATGDPDIPDSISHVADPQFGLRRLIAPVRGVLLVGLVLVGLDAVAQLIVPALVRTGIDLGVTAQSLATLVVVSAVALAVLIADWGVSRAGQLVTGRTGERLLYLLRVKTFAHLQRLGLDYYERELGGRIMTRMTTDVDALSNFLQTGLTTTLISLLTLLGVLIALVLLDAALSLVLVAMLPILVAATLVFRAKSVPTYVEAREKVSVVNAQLQENVAGLRVTQAYRREQRNLTTFLAASGEYLASRLRAQRYISIYFPFVQLLSDLAAAAVLGFGAVRLRDGTLTAGVLIAFFLYLDAFFGPVQQLSLVFDGYQQASVGLARLRDLLRTPTSTPAAEHPRPVGPLRGEIHLRDVHFAYAGGSDEAVAGVDLTVDPGETVALVGETGAGKSSVIKLVARFYDPTGGAVLVDGFDVRELDLPGYRRRLGLVPQEPYLSTGTVRDAIAYGRPDASATEVEEAARAVGAHDTIVGLPGGYEHEVGERGHNLSAGQRQLVALARAELVRPDILLFDEATAALDLASEAAVTRATAAVSRRRTTLVVAHRLTTAARADRIVVLAHGRVVESGTHRSLLEARGTYAALWDAYADRPVGALD
jgi:ATP-binding cassette subfamily B protein